MKKSATSSGARSSKRSWRSQPATIESFSDSDEAAEELQLARNSEPSDKLETDATDNLAGMTDNEMKQHLELCMKLSAENKINTKNAFGLHLIEIMQRLMKSEISDFQQVSLSLQASSKIYSGRVDALYQATHSFHGQLQSVVTGAKKSIEKKDADKNLEEDNSEDESVPIKTKKSKTKSFLTNEDNVTLHTDANILALGKPHGNFENINSAFSTSRTAPKLLQSLQLSCDSCKIRCGDPEPCFKPKAPPCLVNFAIPSRKTGAILDKIKNFDISSAEFQEIVKSTDMAFTPGMSSPRRPRRSVMSYQDISVAANLSPMMAGGSEDSIIGQDIVERFSVLNITADVFVSDISSAVTSTGTVDRNLLPPNSALKKILDTTGRLPNVRSTRKQGKVKYEPFFANRSVHSADVKKMFALGKSTKMTKKNIQSINIESTSVIETGLYEFQIETETEKSTDEDIFNIHDVLKVKDIPYNFKMYFYKQPQALRKSRCRRCSLTRPSSVGTPTRRRLSERRITSGEVNADDLVHSFHNLSLHGDAMENEGNSSVIFSAPSSPFQSEDLQLEPQYGFLETSEIDVEEILVKPPELVKPADVKFAKKPPSINTERVKEVLWNIISQKLKEASEIEDSEPILFSEIYTELKGQMERGKDSISPHFIFVMLLMLSNEKTLLIENIEGSGDLSVKQDTPDCGEIENL